MGVRKRINTKVKSTYQSSIHVECSVFGSAFSLSRFKKIKNTPMIVQLWYRLMLMNTDIPQKDPVLTATQFAPFPHTSYPMENHFLQDSSRILQEKTSIRSKGPQWGTQRRQPWSSYRWDHSKKRKKDLSG